MSILFTPMKLGSLAVENRFVHSATFECMAKEDGKVTDDLVKRYQTLAKEELGLIIPGYIYIHPRGQSTNFQTGIHSDDMIPGLSKITQAVHQEGGKIVFQLAHSGRQTNKATIGRTPMAPSSGSRDPIFMVKPKEMSEEDIQGVIQAFVKAAKRAIEAGADGVQLHAAHGYLINQFISPFFNQRKDGWGVSDENRFRFLREIFTEMKRAMPEEFPVLVKLNTDDHTPREGITLALASKYAGWLADLGCDGLEVSCGTLSYSMFNVMRGNVPVNEIVTNFPWWKKPLGKLMMKRLEGKYDLHEGYNLEAAKTIKPAIGNIPLLLVGGLRTVSKMEEILKNNDADFISMSRPFIREPMIVKKIKEGKSDAVSCVSCNRCLAAVANDIPVRCYNKGFPSGSAKKGQGRKNNGVRS